MKVKKALAGAAAALLLSTGALIGAAPQAQAATGGVSMYWACVHQHGTPSRVDVVAGWT